jgi:hypothetical protein
VHLVGFYYKNNVYLILLSFHGGNISKKVVVIFSPEHTFSNNEILLCDTIQSEFKVNTMNSIDHNIAGCKPANGARMVMIKYGFQKNKLTLYIQRASK